MMEIQDAEVPAELEMSCGPTSGSIRMLGSGSLRMLGVQHPQIPQHPPLKASLQIGVGIGICINFQKTVLGYPSKHGLEYRFN